MKPQPFKRAMAMFAALAAAIRLPDHMRSIAMRGIGPYYSRGKGEGCHGNKRAKSSFKQNKRRGL